jgi:septal ring factor EnvC (AmiA/AmiB activator)
MSSPGPDPNLPQRNRSLRRGTRALANIRQWLERHPRIADAIGKGSPITNVSISSGVTLTLNLLAHWNGLDPISTSALGQSAISLVGGLLGTAAAQGHDSVSTRLGLAKPDISDVDQKADRALEGVKDANKKIDKDVGKEKTERQSDVRRIDDDATALAAEVANLRATVADRDQKIADQDRKIVDRDQKIADQDQEILRTRQESRESERRQREEFARMLNEHKSEVGQELGRVRADVAQAQTDIGQVRAEVGPVPVGTTVAAGMGDVFRNTEALHRRQNELDGRQTTVEGRQQTLAAQQQALAGTVAEQRDVTTGHGERLDQHDGGLAESRRQQGDLEARVEREETATAAHEDRLDGQETRLTEHDAKFADQDKQVDELKTRQRATAPTVAARRPAGSAARPGGAVPGQASGETVNADVYEDLLSGTEVNVAETAAIADRAAEAPKLEESTDTPGTKSDRTKNRDITHSGPKR